MSRSCLVVDDSRVVRKVAHRILEANGFTVDEAEDGWQAFAACRRAMPGWVLLDWNMPNMNGLEFLQAVRREFDGGQPPVVFCTTETEMAFIERAIESGAQEYVMKPFDAEILLGKLEQAGLL